MRAERENVSGKEDPLLTEEQRAIIDYTSDDWYGLWEVDWWFNSAFPDWSFNRRVEFVSQLVRQGLLEIFYGHHREEHRALSCQEAEKALGQIENWRPRNIEEEPVYEASTSKAGLAALMPRASHAK